MSEKRFRANFDVSIYDSETEEYISTSERGLEEIAKRMNEQQATIFKLHDKLFAMQHTIDNQENAIFHLKDTDDNLRKKNIKIEELSKVVHNLKMVLSNDDEQVAKIVGEQQATISRLEEENKELEKNFDDLVQYAGKIAKRNVQLDEEIAKLKKELQKQ